MKYRITIPEPCHEDWDKMTPQDKGRHCDVCDKVVMDFSKYSKRDIINHIKKEGKICGRVPRQYVGIDLEEEKIIKSFGLNGMVATMVNLLALTTVSTAVAQEKPKVEQKSKVLSKFSKSTKLLKKETFVLKGAVKESRTKGLGRVLVQVKGTSYTAMTDDKGNFELRLPVTLDRENCILSCLKDDYFAEEVRVADFDNPIDLEIYKVKLFVEPSVTGKITIKEVCE